MDNVPQQETPIVAATISSPALTAIIPVQHSSYFTKLFHGRLNRGGFLMGCFASVSGLAVALTILAIPLSFIIGIKVTLALVVVIFTIVSNFYLVSLQIRRLHDINRSGYYLLGSLPYTLFSVLSSGLVVAAMTTGEKNITLPQMPTFVAGILTIFSYLSSILFLCLLFWPGTKTANKYGIPSTHWTIKEIFGFTTPQPQNTATTLNPGAPLPPSTASKTSKLFIKIFIVLVIIVVILVTLASFARK